MCGAPKSVGAVFGRTLDLETPGIQAVVSPADRRNGIANTHRTQIDVIRPRTAEPGGSQSARIPPNLEGRGSPNLQGKRQRRPCSTLIQKKHVGTFAPRPFLNNFFARIPASGNHRRVHLPRILDPIPNLAINSNRNRNPKL